MVGTIVTLGKSKSRKLPYDYPKNKHSQFQFDLETVDKKRISVTCPLLNPIINIIIIIIIIILKLYS